MFTQLVSGFGLGFKAQLFGLSMFEMAYPIIVVPARLLSIGKQREKAAMDLGRPSSLRPRSCTGASPASSVHRPDDDSS